MFRSAVRLLARSSSGVVPTSRIAATRAFTACPVLFNNAGSVSMARASLVNCLKAELKHEKENPMESDPNIHRFLKSSGFELTTSLNNREVYLSKTLDDNAKINITFAIDSAQSSFDDEDADSEDNSIEQNEEDDEVLEIPFSLCITQNGQTMTVDMSSFPGDCQVNAISFTKGEIGEDSTAAYPGPQLESLDDTLLDGISEYISTLGVNSELSDFIQGYYVEKEQTEYVNWLSSFKSFL